MELGLQLVNTAIQNWASQPIRVLLIYMAITITAINDSSSIFTRCLFTIGNEQYTQHILLAIARRNLYTEFQIQSAALMYKF